MPEIEFADPSVFDVIELGCAPRDERAAEASSCEAHLEARAFARLAARVHAGGGGSAALGFDCRLRHAGASGAVRWSACVGLRADWPVPAAAEREELCAQVLDVLFNLPRVWDTLALYEIAWWRAGGTGVPELPAGVVDEMPLAALLRRYPPGQATLVAPPRLAAAHGRRCSAS